MAIHSITPNNVFHVVQICNIVNLALHLKHALLALKVSLLLTTVHANVTLQVDGTLRNTLTNVYVITMYKAQLINVSVAQI